MNKLLTAAKLLLRGDTAHFTRRLRIHLRSRRLRRSAGRPFVYRLGAFPFVCIPAVPDSVETFLTGDCDELELALLRAWLQPGDAFVDVGANLGIYSFAAWHFLHGRGAFLAIEASPELHDQLARSSALLGCHDIVFEHKAAGDASREVTFYMAPPGKSRGEQSLHPDPARAGDYVPCRVQMSTLADIVARHPAAAHPAAIKLDIEGAEVMALRGAPSRWFDRDGPLAIVEANPTALARFGHTCATLAGLFSPAEFECWLQPQFAVSGARHLPLRRLSNDESFADAWFYNLIAVPRAPAFAARRARLAPLLATK